MRAYVFDGTEARLLDVPDPAAGSGQVVLEVIAAGLCHSDIHIMERSADTLPFPLPVTLGHEVCGRVVETGRGVTEVSLGDVVAVHGPRGCGTCAHCLTDQENYCRNARRSGNWPIGHCTRGGLADFLLIDDQRALVPLQGLDPIAAAPLTDAGLTPYHAIMQSLHLLSPTATVVVVGVGGLGHLAVQILRTLSESTIVAVDIEDGRLSHALSLGAQYAVLAADALKVVKDLTRGNGADVVLDFVGSTSTVALAVSMLAQRSDLTIVGIGDGTANVGVLTVPLGTTVRTTYWGSKRELEAVLDLARLGSVAVACTTIALSDVSEGYARLARGSELGRIVVKP